MKAGEGISHEYARRIAKLSFVLSFLLAVIVFLSLFYKTQLNIFIILIISFGAAWVGLVLFGLFFGLILRIVKKW